MDLVFMVLALIAGIVASEYIARLLPVSLPPTIIQIAAGVLISLAGGPRIRLEPEVFFLLFLPPLLFLDGWRIPKDVLINRRRAYLELSLGLVFLTVLVVGWLAHWLIPSMPLPVAFALAAALSPTDPIAVSVIARRTPAPKRFMHLLEGEALFNDASGLVAMKFAVAATLTGAFSLLDATTTFLRLALGGLAIGVAVAWAIIVLHRAVVRRAGEDSNAQIFVSLLIPFGAYLAAEQVHCSGILAAVSAGVTMNLVEQGDQISAESRLRRNSVWSSIQAAANGAIFIILGAQLPQIANAASAALANAGQKNPLWLIVYIVALTLAMIGVRFYWAFISVRLEARRAQRATLPDARVVVAMSLAGVKGAVTLASVLALPLTLNDGAPFPARDLSIFLASGVILASLLVATIGLPLVLKGGELAAERQDEGLENEVRSHALVAGVEAIERFLEHRATQEPLSISEVAAAERILARLRAQLQDLRDTPDAGTAATNRFERDLTILALKAQRAALQSRVRLTQTTLRAKLLGELDRLEAALQRL